jgi:hypothetical protein
LLRHRAERKADALRKRPTIKSQTPNKFQALKLKASARLAIDIWVLEITWDLVLGIWDFPLPLRHRAER